MNERKRTKETAGISALYLRSSYQYKQSTILKEEIPNICKSKRVTRAEAIAKVFQVRK
jgi:hypothetical protein